MSLNNSRNVPMCTIYVHRRGVEGCAKDNNCCLDIGVGVQEEAAVHTPWCWAGGSTADVTLTM